MSAVTPLGASKETIEKIAENVAKKMGYRPGADLWPLVEKIGGKIQHQALDSSSETGVIEVRGKRDFTINLSPYSSGRRDRFTIAHELGHYVLHSRIGEIPLVIGREGSDRVEWEANWFAAALLMPAREFTRLVTAGRSAASIAEHFDVSETAVEVRRRSLGLE